MKTIVIGAGHLVPVENIERLASELGISEDEVLKAIEKALPEKDGIESMKEDIHILNNISFPEYDQLPRRSKRKGHERPYKFHP